jgi:hypothetical protein
MGEVVKLNPGNGAREAMIKTVNTVHPYRDNPSRFADKLLAHLWIEGFKVVPLDAGDE